MSKAKTTAEQEGFDRELVRELADLLNETGLTEIEIEKDGLRVRVARPIHVVQAALGVPAASFGGMTAPSEGHGSAPSSRAAEIHPGTVRVADGRHRLSLGRRPVRHPLSRSARR